VGARSGTPPRFQTTSGFNIGGWAYESEEQTRFAFICSSEGFGLPAFDDFVDSLPEGPAKDELTGWREKALSAFKRNDRAEMKAWLQNAWTVWKIHLTHEASRPTLDRGHKFTESKRGRNALYRLAAEILDERGADCSAKNVLSALELLAHESHPTVQEIDPQCIYWVDDKGHEKKTTLHAFESQLSTLRKEIY
jgi:hypothetical protein